MDIVARLLLREEIDALEHDLSEAKATDFARVQALKQEIARLEQRFAAGRRAQSERKFAR